MVCRWPRIEYLRGARVSKGASPGQPDQEVRSAGGHVLGPGRAATRSLSSTHRPITIAAMYLKSSARSSKSRSLRRAWEFESAGDCGRLMVGILAKAERYRQDKT